MTFFVQRAAGVGIFESAYFIRRPAKPIAGAIGAKLSLQRRARRLTPEAALRPCCAAACLLRPGRFQVFWRLRRTRLPSGKRHPKRPALPAYADILFCQSKPQPRKALRLLREAAGIARKRWHAARLFPSKQTAVSLLF
jgi:hypothetical protein